MLVELLCLLIFAVRLVHYAKVIPRDKFWKDPKNICIIVIITVGGQTREQLRTRTRTRVSISKFYGADYVQEVARMQPCETRTGSSLVQVQVFKAGVCEGGRCGLAELPGWSSESECAEETFSVVVKQPLA